METKQKHYKPEVWGGIECTINRVNNHYRDQLDYAGHYIRPGDIEHLAALGITAIRYPVLWERHQPDENNHIDWRWITGQLEALKKNNIVPIAGLLHHGSGPADTDLLDKGFPDKLAAYAGKVARQFPWLTYYTPVNEPLTTARFSGLYGYWYPHHKNNRSFILMLLNQVKGIILSMQEIRKVNPVAKLVQTEDLAKTHSTKLLAYQANFENERRWLTYDLLCGKFNQQHYFWNYFLDAGIAEHELQFFIDNACPPDTMGFNYYVTSERWLNENFDGYNYSSGAGNGLHEYTDTAAVQSGKMAGLKQLLTEAWERYRLPMAVTECHINCSREEQLRWLKETWDVCVTLNQTGVIIKAVTAWSLMGACDWDTLLAAAQHNRYESGVFDVSRGDLRPTALAKMIRSLAISGDYEHPLLAASGWWRAVDGIPDGMAPALIIGEPGTLINAFIQACKTRRISLIFATRSEVEFLDYLYQPWATIELFVDAKSIACSGNLEISYENGNENAATIAQETLNLLIDEEQGQWHISMNGMSKKSMQPAMAFAYIAE